MKLVYGLCGAVLMVTAIASCDGETPPVDLVPGTSALSSVGGGAAYATQCMQNQVPLPEDFGTSTLGTGPRRWNQAGPGFEDGFTVSNDVVTIYTMESDTPQGICVVATHQLDAVFSVICQGTSGKACFWEATGNYWPGRVSPPPPEVPVTPIKIVGSDFPAAPDQSSQCTACHVGENVFITHANLDHPTNQNQVPGWMPTSFYDPIVPSSWVKNVGPSTPGFSQAGYPSTCLTCHTPPNNQPFPLRAGRLPLLRNRGLPPIRIPAATEFCFILKKVVSLPPLQGGMPANGPDCTPGVNCPFDNDPSVRAMVAACGNPLPALTASPQVLGAPYGVPASSVSTTMHVSQSQPGMHSHGFSGATTTMPSSTCCTPYQNQHQTMARDDTINVWVFIPTFDPPTEIMLEITNNNGQSFRAFWGADQITNLGARTRISGLPPAGSWQPLAFRPVNLGITIGLRLTGMKYILFNGSAYWADTLFRQAASPYDSRYVSQVWVKDSVPAGSTKNTTNDSWSFELPTP
jgi:hypothetical protein